MKREGSVTKVALKNNKGVAYEYWQCRYYEHKGTLFCSIGIHVVRASGEAEWVWKDNAGAPSNMEAQKGEASDALTKIAA